jgi:hypothetical protein
MRLLTAIPSAVVLISIASAPARCTETRQAAATIDVTKNGARISKNIYGQFIEHLGRCIYVGLWAEMFEDRSFYYPVTGRGYGLDDHRRQEHRHDGVRRRFRR